MASSDLPSLAPRSPIAEAYNVAEVMLFTACNFNCGYCGFVTTGAVKNVEDMAPFKDRSYIDRVFQFFEKNSTDGRKWILHLSGGEPLLMPNADYFSRKFIGAGHKLAFNTNLSLPIEKNDWMVHNPPWGVDALIVSLHQEALGRFDKIYERVRILREQGYPICIRMVAHPLFIDKFAELDDKFKDIDVSFNVNPLYSPRYPKAYTEEERTQIISHMKVNYEVIRLNGGLDATGKKCHAGSRMLCLTLGLSGGGRVYPCVNVSTPEHEMGNIFEDDIELYSEPTSCLRADNCCSCAIHFTHNIVPWADDSASQHAMLAGYKPSVADTWQEWFETRKIRTKQHSSEPQGTLEGESQLVIKKTRRSRDMTNSLPDPAFLRGAKLFEIPALSEWKPVDQTIAEFEINADDSLVVQSKPQKYGYLLVSPTIQLPYGHYVIDFRLNIELGGVTVGISDEEITQWQLTENYHASTNGRLILTAPPRGMRVRVVIAACNPYGEATTKFTLKSLQTRRSAALFAHYRADLERRKGNWLHKWRTEGKSFVYNRKADLLKVQGRSLLAVKRGGPRLSSSSGSYQVVDTVDVGYAVRSIAPVRGKDGSLCLLTADVGDDSVSVVPVRGGRLMPRQRIQFPKQSTPMCISTVRRPDGSDIPIVSFFNFDTTATNHKKTYVAAIDDVAALSTRREVNDIKRELSVLLERHGHWGFRGTCVEQRPDLSYQIGAVDRNADMFYLLTGKSDEGRIAGEVERLDIGEPTEPIGVSAAPAPDDPGQCAFYMSSRKSEDLVVAGRNSDGNLEVRQRYPLRGMSRSSIAVGRMIDRERCDVAVALWGGDPTNLNSANTGSFVVGQLAPDGAIEGEVREQAGINPTDIVAGDFDGDGLDEIAVLNYGNGLGPADRTIPGGVEIYKYIGRGFTRVAQFGLANPRIATVMDIDGDGRQELILSLFFERRLVVIKCL